MGLDVKKYKWPLIIVLTCGSILAINILSNNISIFESETWWKSKVLVADKASTNKELRAKIITTENIGTYIFLVTSVKNDLVKKKSISAPVGYHPHAVTLSWNSTNTHVAATIDHDFGEGNVVSKITLDSE